MGAKLRFLEPGNGLVGPHGNVFRNLLNDMIPANALLVPENFNWAGDLTEYAGKTFLISYAHALSGTITLPACNLLFDGGEFTGSAIIVGNVCRIINIRNSKCFDVTITFTGTWTETVAAPQWFGAVCTANPKTLPGAAVPLSPNPLNRKNEGGAVSSSPAIQALFNSPFKPWFPNGYYYITTSCIITRQISVDFGAPVMEMIDEMSLFHYRNDHVRFYTDQDINFWEYRTHSIFLKGGVMDVQNVPTFSHTLYYAHAKYKIFYGEASGWGIGSLENCRKEGAVGTYFRWDMTNLGASQYGYLTAFDIACNLVYISRGFIIDDPIYRVAPFTWCNGITINAFVDGCKIAAILAPSTVAQAKIMSQARYVLTEAEKNDPPVHMSAGGGKLDLATMDIDPLPDGTGYYTYPTKNSLVYTSGGYTLDGYGLTSQHVKLKSIDRPRATRDITHESKPVILKQNSTRDSFLSEFHNFFIGFHKSASNSVSVKAYKGGSMNFTTELRDGATIGLVESTDYMFNYFDNLFEQRGYSPQMLISQSANRDTDFVEIMLTSAADMYLSQGWLSLVENSRNIKRVQWIVLKNDGTYKILVDDTVGRVASYAKPYFDFVGDNGEPVGKKYIIRLIGSTVATPDTTIGNISINDLAGKQSIAAPKPGYVASLDAANAELAVVLNQSGLLDPVLEVIHNSFYGSAGKMAVTSTRQSVGKYRLTCGGQFTSAKCLPRNVTFYTELGKINFARTNADYYTISTYNTLGVLSDGILVEQTLMVNRYW